MKSGKPFLCYSFPCLALNASAGIWANHEPTFSCQQYSCHDSLAESNRWMRGGKAGTLMARTWDLFPRIFLPSIFLPDFALLSLPPLNRPARVPQFVRVFHDVLKFSFGSSVVLLVTRHMSPVTLRGREPLQTDVGKTHRRHRAAQLRRATRRHRPRLEEFP